MCLHIVSAREDTFFLLLEPIFELKMTALSVAILLLVVYISTTTNALDNGLAMTPPMGWMSWERFTCQIDCYYQPTICINEKLYRETADRLQHDGYLELGYEYVNIDDCWSEKQRDNVTDNLVPDKERFSSGIKSLADYVHSKGLKLGIYGDCGTKTCAGYPAQLRPDGTNYTQDNYFEKDANLFNAWEIDSFKFDGCFILPDKAESICPLMAHALNKTNRPILLTCEWPFYMLRERSYHLNPDYNLAEKSCNLWRYYEDVEDSWLSILSIVDFSITMQEEICAYHGPGGWFDPDQLVIGNFGLSLNQARAQMAIWSIWSAPLFMSNDLRHIHPSMAAILKNEKVIAVDQDPLGLFGQMVQQEGKFEVFVKAAMPIKKVCPSFVIVVLYRETLGNSKPYFIKMRDTLKRVPRIMWTQLSRRIATLEPERKIDVEACVRQIQTAMTVVPRIPPEGLIQPTNLPARQPSLQETPVYYHVEDLFDDILVENEIGLNSSIGLTVNPSGVRMIKLTEID